MIQTIEAIKYLTGVGAPLVNKIFIFDALNNDFTIVDVDKAPNCALCGTNPTITSPIANEAVAQ
jgi:adenylyltransferase/sulfurtransferase